MQWPPLQPGKTAVAPVFSIYSHFLPLRTVPLEGDELFSPTQTFIHCSRNLSGKHLTLYHSTDYPSSPVEPYKHLYLSFHANGLFFFFTTQHNGFSPICHTHHFLFVPVTHHCSETRKCPFAQCSCTMSKCVCG